MVRSLFLNIFIFAVLSFSVVEGMVQSNQQVNVQHNNEIKQQVEEFFELNRLNSLLDVIKKAQAVKKLFCCNFRQLRNSGDFLSFSRARYAAYIREHCFAQTTLPWSLQSNTSLAVEFILKTKFEHQSGRAVWLLHELQRNGYGAVYALLKEGLSQEEKELSLASTLINNEQVIDEINDIIEGLINNEETLKTVVCFAMEKKHHEMLEILAACFDNPLEDLYNDALSCGHKEIIEDCVNASTQTPQELLSTVDQEDVIPLAKVAQSGDIEAFMYVWGLFDEDQLTQQLEHKDYNFEMNVLMNACEKGHSNIVDCIISNSNKESLNRQLDAAAEEALSPIAIACINGHSDIIAQLLACYSTQEQKIDALCKTDTFEMTPLMNAIGFDQASVVHFLLNTFKKIDISGKLLIDQLSHCGSDGKNAIKMAASHGRLKIFTDLLDVYKKHKLLLTNELRVLDNNFNSLFEIVSLSGRVDVVKAFVSAYDEEERSRLACMATVIDRCNIDIFKKRFAFLNTRLTIKDFLNVISPSLYLINLPHRDTGDNAIAFAVENGNLDILKLFISIVEKSGASLGKMIHACNKKGKSAFMIAQENNQEEILNLFTQCVGQ